MSIQLKDSKTFQEVLKEVQKEYQLKADLKMMTKDSRETIIRKKESWSTILC